MSTTSRSFGLRGIAVAASLSLALAGTGIAATSALAASSSASDSAASTATATGTAATTSTATEGSLTDEIAQQAIGDWELIDLSINTDGMTDEEAQSAEFAVSMISLMGVNVDLSFVDDGSYEISYTMSSFSMDESLLGDTGSDSTLGDFGSSTSDTTVGTWYSDGEGVVLDETMYGVLNTDGTLTLAADDGTVMVFATTEDIDAGLFTPLGGTDPAENYVTDVNGFAYTWDLTDLASGGYQISLATVNSLAGDASSMMASQLIMNEDGTCTFILENAGETQTLTGTWVASSDGMSATITFEDGSENTVTIDADGALHFVDPSDETSELIYHVLKTDEAASSDADATGASAAKAVAMAAAASESTTAEAGTSTSSSK